MVSRQPRRQGLLAFQYAAAILESERTLGTRLGQQKTSLILRRPRERDRERPRTSENQASRKPEIKRYLDALVLEPVIGSCGFCQQIPCFDSCQLTIIWISNTVQAPYTS